MNLLRKAFLVVPLVGLMLFLSGCSSGGTSGSSTQPATAVNRTLDTFETMMTTHDLDLMSQVFASRIQTQFGDLSRDELRTIFTAMIEANEWLEVRIRNRKITFDSRRENAIAVTTLFERVKSRSSGIVGSSESHAEFALVKVGSRWLISIM